MQKKVRKSATKNKTDLLIRTEDKGDTWPKAVLDAAGAFPGSPSLREIRKCYGADVRREPAKKLRTLPGK